MEGDSCRMPTCPTETKAIPRRLTPAVHAGRQRRETAETAPRAQSLPGTGNRLLVQGFVDLAHQLGRRLQGLVSLVLPLGGAGLVFLPREVEVRLELAQHLVDVASEVVEVHLGVEKDSIRVDDERPS